MTHGNKIKTFKTMCFHSHRHMLSPNNIKNCIVEAKLKIHLIQYET